MPECSKLEYRTVIPGLLNFQKLKMPEDVAFLKGKIKLELVTLKLRSNYDFLFHLTGFLPFLGYQIFFFTFNQ